MHAVERLRDAGEQHVGMLLVVGAERGSGGAAAANTTAPGSRYLVNDEPTDSRPRRFTRGVLRLKLRAQGRAAHSSQPQLGASAIDARAGDRRVDDDHELVRGPGRGRERCQQDG